MRKTGNKNKRSLHNANIIKKQIERINQSDLIRESEKIIKYSWQNVVLVVSLMVLILFVGYQFMMKHDAQRKQTEFASEQTMAVDEKMPADPDETVKFLNHIEE